MIRALRATTTSHMPTMATYGKHVLLVKTYKKKPTVVKKPSRMLEKTTPQWGEQIP